MRDQIFFSLLVGFGLGIGVRSFVYIGNSGIVLLLFISIALCVVLILRQKFFKYIFVPVGIIALALGVSRFNLSDTPPPQFLEQQVGTKVSLSGIVVDDPDLRDTNTKLDVLVFSGDESGHILVSVDPYSSVLYGDEIRVSGTLKKPENFMTDQGKEFDYVSYLWKDDIRYLISYGKVEVVSSGHGNIIREKLFDFKHALLKKFSLLVPYPESGLLGGVLIGSKEFLSGDLRDQFITTGTIHIVALSGYNVSIVAEAIMGVFRFFFSQMISVGLGIVAIVLFVLMTGASATAVRAGIMGTLVLVARITGRPYAIGRALLLAGALMVLWNPRTLVFDVSFQLSFIATLGLIFLSPIVERWFRFLPTKFFREIVSATIAAQIAVLPFLIYKMGVLSIVSLPINLFILPFIPFSMMFGAAAGFLSFISHLIAMPFAYLTYGLLHYIFKMVDVGASIPYAAINIKSFPLWGMIVCYFGIGVWVVLKQKTIIKNSQAP